MRIATWNINGLRARLDYLRLWLEDRAPDIVGLQELKLADDAFPHDAFAELGYRAVVHGQKSWNGVAVLSREEPSDVRRGLDGEESFGARLIRADVAGVRFTTVYCPNGKRVEHDDFPRKLRWFERLAEQVREDRGTAPSVLCGDFNVCPAPIDSWNEDLLRGGIFHTEDERRRFRAVLETGLRDVFRVKYPERAAFSWWDYRGGAFHRKQGLRIDFLLADEALTGRLREVTIDRDFRKKKDGRIASDHAPVFADFD